MPNEYTDTINNLSYTNKDFASIYRELLELVPTLTNKWNPQNSNESDPGVVLLKLLAIIGDKLNYTVDKNILEAFPASVTQLSNARQLYDSLGYDMHWYKSATTTIALKYQGNEIDEGKSSRNSFTIPPFTMVTNDSGTSVYTLLGTAGISGATFSAKNEILSVNAIEGVINKYEVGGSNTITLANLDADLCLYFPNSQVAENGIFICNVDENNFDDWQKISNLQSNKSNSFVYKFGVVAGTNTCYIQFSQDIANIIGNGLNIYYISSQGVEGNVSANTISKFYSDVEIQEDTNTVTVTESFAINNPSASVNGSNPETVEEAYNSYKKIVGTFDTLITCRDYENALYQHEDVLSNAVVSDRTNDINYTNHIMTDIGTGAKKVLKVTQTDDTPDMTAFDIGIYGLYPMLDNYSTANYNKSFSACVLNKSDFENLLTENKSCQHDFIDITNASLLYLFKNFFSLTGKILTNYKVTETEAANIEENIRQALYKNFNARAVSFGDEPEFDTIVSVIQNADTRIKTVILDEPIYTLKKLASDDTLGTISSAIDIQQNENDLEWTKLVARLVLNGTVQLYKFDTRFDYNFGQISDSNSVVENIVSITTEAVIPYEDPDFTETTPNSLKTGYLLKKNENIQVFGPSLITTKTFTTYVEYEFVGLTDDIPENVNYELKANEHLYVSYLDSNSVRQTRSNNAECAYNEGDIICCSFTVEPDATGTLTASDTIDIKKINQTVLNISSFGKYAYCYWITNVEQDHKDVLFAEGQTEKLLDNNEYFIYTDSSKSDLVILGSGTKLVRTSASSAIINTAAVSRTSINNDGLDAFGSTDWYIWDLSNNNTLTIIENQIYAFGEGTYIKLVNSSDKFQTGVTNITSKKITNIEVASSTFLTQEPDLGRYYFVYSSSNWKLNNVNVTLSTYGITLYPAGVIPNSNDSFVIENGVLRNGISKVSSVEYGTDISSLSPISDMNLSSYSWEALSRLNLNASPTESQQLLMNQKMIVNYMEDEESQSITYTGWTSDCLMFNESLFVVGGENIDAAVTSYSGETDYTLAVYKYKSIPVISKVQNLGDYHRIPSGNIRYGQGTKYEVPTTINANTTSTPTYTVDSTAAGSTYQATLDNIALPDGTVFSTNFDLTAPGIKFISAVAAEILIRNVILPFHFESTEKYIISVLKIGNNHSFTIKSDDDDVIFKILTDEDPVTATDLELEDPGMYYITPVFLNSATSCEKIIVTSTLGTNTETTDYLDVYKPHVILDTANPQGDQLATPAMLSKVESWICGRNIFGSPSATQANYIDQDGEFDYTYEVPNTDLIDVQTINSPEAFWSSNNPFSKYTIAQIDTKNMSIKVAPSSKVLR